MCDLEYLCPRSGIVLTGFKVIDYGPDQGIELCADEGQLGLQLMQSLPPHMQRAAQIYPSMVDSTMPEDRWNPADQVSDCSRG